MLKEVEFLTLFRFQSKHIEICERQRRKQRKVFDSSKQRAVIDAKGNPIAPSSPIKSVQSKNNSKAKDSMTSKSNWRDQHEEFIRTVRQARGVKVSNQSDSNREDDGGRRRIPPGYVECPTCDRKFSKGAGERHIPWCKEQKARIPRNGNNGIPIKTNPQPRNNKAKSQYAQVPSTVKRHNDLNTSKNLESTDKSNPNGLNRGIRKPVVRYRSPVRKEAMSKVKARLKMEEQVNKQHPKTPVMKFKEKFPNHVRSTLDSITSKFLQEKENREEILKKPDNFSGPMIPKTVPGVRTRGLSPIRYDGKKLSLETEDLLRMKAQISEMYPVKSEGKLNFIDKLLNYDNGEGSNNSSGIHSPASITKSKFQENIKKKNETNGGDSDLPRFCHQCGTKYPGNGSKFCHECGAKRLKSGGAFLAN